MSLKRYVTDTMALILHLEKRQMPETAKKCFLETENGEAEMIVPTMVLVELSYLSYAFVGVFPPTNKAIKNCFTNQQRIKLTSFAPLKNLICYLFLKQTKTKIGV